MMMNLLGQGWEIEPGPPLCSWFPGLYEGIAAAIASVSAASTAAGTAGAVAGTTAATAAGTAGVVGGTAGGAAGGGFLSSMAGLSVAEGMSLNAGLLSAATGLYQGISSSNAAKAEAEAAQKQSNMDAAGERRKTAALLSQRQAMGAAAGVDIGSGSPLETALHEAYLGEMNAQTIKHQGALTAYGKKQEASQYRMGGYAAGLGGLLKSSSLMGSYLKKPAVTASLGRASSFDSWWGG